MTYEQCKAARAFLNITQAELAELSSVSKRTIFSFEKGDRTPYAENINALKSALEQKGIQFLQDGVISLGAGVSLRE